MFFTQGGMCMLILGTVEFENGKVGVDVLDVSSGLVSRHVIEQGGITALMKDLRS